MFSSGEQIDSDSLSGLMATGGHEARTNGNLGHMAMAASRGIVSPTALPGVFRVERKVQPAAVSRTPASGPAAMVPTGDVAPGSTDNWPTLEDVERLHLERTLAATLQNKSMAAKLLGIDRSVLRRKLQRYGLGDG
jgi:DNA-binding NtrC family response regulator